MYTTLGGADVFRGRIPAEFTQGLLTGLWWKIIPVAKDAEVGARTGNEDGGEGYDGHLESRRNVLID